MPWTLQDAYTVLRNPGMFERNQVQHAVKYLGENQWINYSTVHNAIGATTGKRSFREDVEVTEYIDDYRPNEDWKDGDKVCGMTEKYTRAYKTTEKQWVERTVITDEVGHAIKEGMNRKPGYLKDVFWAICERGGDDERRAINYIYSILAEEGITV